MVLPQAMAWVQYWFRVLSLKFGGKSKKIGGDTVTAVTRFFHVWLRVLVTPSLTISLYASSCHLIYPHHKQSKQTAVWWHCLIISSCHMDNVLHLRRSPHSVDNAASLALSHSHSVSKSGFPGSEWLTGPHHQHPHHCHHCRHHHQVHPRHHNDWSP